mmetsp:Transcript_22495/g.35208  ORF Transcript_22495/g.35208 Transcript_22495/m.35208 type:complete len:138 (+) Transcript_22495:111-524(+)
MASKASRPFRSLAEKLAMLPAAAKPTKVTVQGREAWRKPTFSRRQLADMKKECLLQGVKWPMEEKPPLPPGESYYERKVFRCKGHKDERDKPARMKDIETKLANMPKRIEEWRAENAKAKVKTELQKILSMGKKKKY